MAGGGVAEGRRALSALLAGRVKKPKREHKTQEKLQEAALYVLTCHQDLDELLLETGNSEQSKPSCSSNFDRGRNKASVPDVFVVSALRDKASLLGVPMGILSARAAANAIGKISVESDQTSLLNEEQRKKMLCLLQSLKELSTDNVFCRFVFAQEIWKMQCPILLEVAWHLHREGIVRLEELLEKNPDAAAGVDWLCSSLCHWCHQMGESSLDRERGQGILTDFAIVLLQNGFQKTAEFEKKLEMKKISEICCAVLDRMLAWVLDAVAQEKQDSATPTLKAVECWLQVYSIMAFQGTIPAAFLYQFFRHIFTQVLTYNPHLKVSDAILLQREWSFARTSSALVTLYSKLFTAFRAEELIRFLQQVLETSEVNWHHVLSCVSTLLVCHSDAQPLLKDLLGCLLRKAFENYDLENIITAFLIIRQAALEGPALFTPYADWFKSLLSSLLLGVASSHHSGSKKALVFFFKFLSQLVPFEAPQYLKVPIEDMGLYERPSPTKEACQPYSQALQDVEKAVQIFRTTGKIPASVMEASIFRRSYYTTYFLPALLVPRGLPETPDACMALIESLKRAEKIPLNMYATYIEACHAAKNAVLPEGVAEVASTELLKAELEALRLLITEPSKQGAVPAQIAVVSEKLTEVLGRVKDEDEVASLTLRIQLNLLAPEVGHLDQGVVDLLLTSFCQNILAASYVLPPDRQGPWPSLFVKMICGHRHLLSSLLNRLCQLLSHQGPSLSDVHVPGLAAFAVHLSEAESFFPPLDVCGSSTLPSASQRELSLSELWDDLLVLRSGESVAFCMRFCTAALSYFFCKFSSLSWEHMRSILPPAFVKRKAALGLWKRASFQELLREEAFLLTLREWLRMELGVLPDEDALSSWERQEFHRWALYQHYLPMSVAAGGCDGSLRELCAAVTGAILDFCQRSEPDASGLPKTHRRGNPDIYCRFQELVLELQRQCWRGSSKEEHFLFQVFRERLKPLGKRSALGEGLHRQQELLFQTRVLVGLSPSTLFAVQKNRGKVAVECEDFFCFVNTELRNSCSRGCSLSYDLTAHFFRGLLTTSLECNNPAQEVTAVLSSCQARCPTILCSAARWWPRLEPVLCSEWERLFGAPLAGGLQHLKDLQSSLNSFLSSEATALPSDLTWVSAAFLHFAVQREAREKVGEGLQRMGPGAGQFLVYVLFFSVMDFISARIALQEGVEVSKILDWSSQVLQCLTGRGAGWLAVFCPAGRGRGLYELLHDAVSDLHLWMLPVAFYSLLLTFDAEQLIREPVLLPIAVDLYTQLLQGWTEGTAVVEASEKEQSLPSCQLEDSLSLIKQARQLLLRAIAQCPQESCSHLQPMLDLCGALDPELTSALTMASAGRDLLKDGPCYSESRGPPAMPSGKSLPPLPCKRGAK